MNGFGLFIEFVDVIKAQYDQMDPTVHVPLCYSNYWHKNDAHSVQFLFLLFLWPLQHIFPIDSLSQTTVNFPEPFNVNKHTHIHRHSYMHTANQQTYCQPQIFLVSSVVQCSPVISCNRVHWWALVRMKILSRLWLLSPLLQKRHFRRQDWRL